MGIAAVPHPFRRLRSCAKPLPENLQLNLLQKPECVLMSECRKNMLGPTVKS